MFWPAWRLYDLFMGVLVYFTWKYAWRARDLKVVYSELGRSNKLAEDLERSREQTEQKNFFLNAISHDLRTPLNGLALQASLAELSLNANDTQTLKVALAEIRASTIATSELLDRLLEFGRAGVPQPQSSPSEQFALAPLLSELTDRFRAAAERKGLRLYVCESNALCLHSDRLAVSRVLANLLDNAIKFTDQGSVRVEVDGSESGVEIHVIDTGIGISTSDSARLFEEFYQVHNNERDRSKGFGIGLAIARRLARQLGGDVLLESAPGSGSRFSLVVPNAAAAGSSNGGAFTSHQRVPAGAS
jgi:signal transduction histidine kinase